MADSISVINRPREFPSGCGSNSLKNRHPFRCPPQTRIRKPLTETANRAALSNTSRVQEQKPSETEALGSSIRGQNRPQRKESPNKEALGSRDRVQNRPQPTENPNKGALGSRDRVQAKENPNEGVLENRDRVLAKQNPNEGVLGKRDRVQQVSRPIRVSERDRERALDVLRRFRERCDEIRSSNRSRPEMKALPEFMELKTGHPKSIGPIPGVEVGQVFLNRAELIVAGVHGKTTHGIELTEPLHGRSFATCVVAKEGYHDKMHDPDFLQYGGEGGEVSSNGGSKNSKKRRILKPDQKMEGGNLAMKNSIEVGNEVRVVRGVKDPLNRRILYVYDGLYQVLDCRNVGDSERKVFFQFDLRRIPGQEPIDWKNVHLKAV